VFSVKRVLDRFTLILVYTIVEDERIKLQRI